MKKYLLVVITAITILGSIWGVNYISKCTNTTIKSQSEFQDEKNKQKKEFEKEVHKSVDLYDFEHYVQECVWYRDLLGKNSYLSEHIGERMTFRVEFWKDMKKDTDELIYIVYDEVNEVHFIGEKNSSSGRIEYRYSDFFMTGLVQMEELEPVWIDITVEETKPHYEYSEKEQAEMITKLNLIYIDYGKPKMIFLLDDTLFWEKNGERISYYYIEEESGQISLFQRLDDEDSILATYASKDAMTLKQRIAYERVVYQTTYSVGLTDESLLVKAYVPTKQEEEILTLWKDEYLSKYDSLNDTKVYVKGIYTEQDTLFIEAFYELPNGTVALDITLVTEQEETYTFAPGGTKSYSVDSMMVQYEFQRLKYQMYEF